MCWKTWWRKEENSNTGPAFFVDNCSTISLKLTVISARFNLWCAYILKLEEKQMCEVYRLKGDKTSLPIKAIYIGSVMS